VPAEQQEAALGGPGFAGLVLVTTNTGVVGSLGAPLIPRIAETEQVSLATAQWALTATLLVGAVLSPVVGRLGTGARRRRVMIAVLGLVTLGTLLAALPLGIGWMIAGRALQGLAFSVTPLAFSVARDCLPPHRQRRALATLSVTNVVAAGLGFPVAAVAAELTGVRGAYALGVLLTGGALVTALLVVPRSTAPHAGRVDAVGAVLLGGATLAVLLAITQGEGWGWRSAPILALLLGAVLLAGGCVAWLRRARRPLLDLRLARHPVVLAAHLAAVLAGCGMYLMLSLVMTVVQAEPHGSYGLGASVVVAGLMLSPYAVASAAGNRAALALGARLGQGAVLPIGCLLFGLADLLLGVLPLSVPGLLFVMTVAGVASGMTFNAIPWLVVGVVPAAEIGSVMSFNVVVRYLGFSVGSALALALLELFADDHAAASRSGLVAGALVGAAACVVGALVCLVLARSGRHARPVPADAAGSVA